MAVTRKSGEESQFRIVTGRTWDMTLFSWLTLSGCRNEVAVERRTGVVTPIWPPLLPRANRPTLAPYGGNKQVWTNIAFSKEGRSFFFGKSLAALLENREESFPPPPNPLPHSAMLNTVV